MAARFQNPILGIFLAFLSHYLLDIPPHKEYSVANIKGRRWKQSYFDFIKVFLDISSAFAVIYFLIAPSPMVYLGAFAAIIPDSLTLAHIIFPQNQLLSKHFSIHVWLNEIGEKAKIPVSLRLFSQLAAAVLAIYFLL